MRPCAPSRRPRSTACPSSRGASTTTNTTRPGSSRSAAACPLRPDDNRISLVFTLPHRDGSLAAALSVCADHEINLTEIHSRPLPETPWEYRFYIDLEGSLCDPAVRAMIYQLEEELSTVRILGSYRISDSTEGEVTSL